MKHHISLTTESTSGSQPHAGQTSAAGESRNQRARNQAQSSVFPATPMQMVVSAVPGMRTILLCTTALILLCTGCVSVRMPTLDDLPEVEGDIYGPTWYRDEWVRRGQARFMVRPETPPIKPPTALFFPFRIRQATDNPVHLGTELGRAFWQIWTEKRTMPIMEFGEDLQWKGAAQAVTLARAYGADLAIGGDVTYFLHGGTVGATRLALRMYVYDAASGYLIWSMEHSGSMQQHLPKDFVLFTERTRLPADPMAVISAALASDLSLPVRAWATGESNGEVNPLDNGDEATTTGADNGLFSLQDPTQPPQPSPQAVTQPQVVVPPVQKKQEIKEKNIF